MRQVQPYIPYNTGGLRMTRKLNAIADRKYTKVVTKPTTYYSPREYIADMTSLLALRRSISPVEFENLDIHLKNIRSNG